ncbi:hypothetical protein ACLHWS_12535 [Flavobacterium psychrophilum]|uniref:hypothetical protein n=1 Tax=Flavobacterium psychrophilum TaxID=96345 RepID=UPI0039854E3A
MKKTALLLSLFFGLNLYSQTVSDIQQQNARATGYAIIASKNPGVDFSVYVIPWDGIGTLEYNATTQINPSWHAQAAIKGNFFGQAFDGSNFSGYSSVVTSEAQFDLYKSNGIQWWIVCSTLPAFSDIAGKSRLTELSVEAYSPLVNLKRNTATGGFIQGIQTKLENNTNNWFYGNLGEGSWMVAKGDYNSPKLIVNQDGNVGIGTSSPLFKLDVVGKSSFSDNMVVQGKIESKEVKVTTTPTADFVFEENYAFPSLESVEKHIKEKKHLPEIASAKEMKKEGVNIGEFQIKLLQKIEELTLYTIEQNKQLIEQNKKITHLEQDLQAIKEKNNQ